MAHQQPIRNGTDAARREIPDKLYFRIGEVARLCEVPAYVLRFWESEFPQLKPNKGGTGQRLYRRRDVEMALRIKTLLYDEGYTIPGARQLLKSEVRQKEPQLALGVDAIPGKAELQKLRRLRKEMQELLNLLAEPTAKAKGGPVQQIRGPRQRPTVTEAESGSDGLFDELF
jgi:DNA-binding transcriptional MerR regulator